MWSGATESQPLAVTGQASEDAAYLQAGTQQEARLGDIRVRLCSLRLPQDLPLGNLRSVKPSGRESEWAVPAWGVGATATAMAARTLVDGSSADSSRSGHLQQLAKA